MAEELKKIAIVGPESTGKSQISQQLAQHFDTEWVPEFARFYLDRLDRPYERKDLLEIAKGQITWEEEKATYANEFLFCDTNLIVIKIWSDHKYGATDPWIEEKLQSQTYDYYLLGNIDIPWAPDPQREHPTRRAYFFSLYKEYLESRSLPYAVVSGIEETRKKNAVEAINNWLRMA